jgi:hypothetical protein
MSRLNPLRSRAGNLIRDSRELIPGFGPEQGISLKIDLLAADELLIAGRRLNAEQGIAYYRQTIGVGMCRTPNPDGNLPGSASRIDVDDRGTSPVVTERAVRTAQGALSWRLWASSRASTRRPCRIFTRPPSLDAQVKPCKRGAAHFGRAVAFGYTAARARERATRNFAAKPPDSVGSKLCPD